ncbi:ferredoxin--NADP reductase [Gordonia mangrovi]|nr:ferredoxin--NADP reductase [Gordonia mangrovi]UVF76634.1 ferredoxin--NADP reductase [Gordonia mangrovi]
MNSLMVRVAEVVPETADAVSIVFEENELLPAYRPGQYLTLRVPSDLTGSVARCYSLASSPHSGEPARVIVKRTASGYASNWLCDNLAAGAEIEIKPPAGVFTPKSLEHDLLLFAGGSGITPALSIAKSVLLAGTGSIDLFYANRDEASVIAADELKALEQRFPERLSVRHWLESLQGLPHPDVLRRMIDSAPTRQAFVCGPAPFMDAVRSAWTASGRLHSEIHMEVFTSLSGDPFAERVPAPAAAADAETVPTEVELEGEVHTIEWPKGVTLVDHLLSVGIEVPYMCRDGDCGTCIATCTEGSVEMVGNNLLEEEDIANGDVLTCQLMCVGDSPVKVVY